MIFQDFLKDIAKLQGLHLSSIRPGSDIFIEKVDLDGKRIVIRNKQGKIRKRSVAEFEKIWNALMNSPAVHVDEILFGSGSSRNQPETIVANLPYIEWLKITNKKHIAYIGEATHAFGTLKQMDSIKANEVVERYTKENEKAIKSVISTKNLSKDVCSYQTFSGKTSEAISEKIYVFPDGEDYLLFLDANYYNLPEGTYIVVNINGSNHTRQKIELLDKSYKIVSFGAFKGLYEC